MSSNHWNLFDQIKKSFCLLSVHSYGNFKSMAKLFISWYRIDVLCMFVGYGKK